MSPSAEPIANTPAVLVRADNPGPMTLTGTNTWVVHHPQSAMAVVIDPGPDDDSHLTALRHALTDRAVAVEVVLLTHGHADHSGGAHRFAAAVGAELRAADSVWGPRPLVADEKFHAGGLNWHVVATPGHTSDSVSLRCDNVIFTGDTVLGAGTTVVAHPDGRLGDYLDSLARLRLLAEQGVSTLLPGHGPVITSPAEALDHYLTHRRARLDAVAAVLAENPGLTGEAAVNQVVRTVYADVPEHLWPAAALSVRAQVEYLGGS